MNPKVETVTPKSRLRDAFEHGWANVDSHDNAKVARRHMDDWPFVSKAEIAAYVAGYRAAKRALASEWKAYREKVTP